MNETKCCLIVSEGMDHENKEMLYQFVKFEVEGLGIDICVPDEDSGISAVQDAVKKSAFVVADISERSTGVLYAVGFADALGKPVVGLCRRGSKAKTPVDLSSKKVISYSLEKVQDRSRDSLRKTIEGIRENEFKDVNNFSRPRHSPYQITDFCFVITRIGEEETLSRQKSDACMDFVIKYVVRACPGYRAVRGDHTHDVNQIPDQVRKNIYECGFAIVNMFEPNQNVAYELGYAHGLEKPVILIKEINSVQEIQDAEGSLKWADWLWNLNCFGYTVDDNDTEQYHNSIEAIQMEIKNMPGIPIPVSAEDDKDNQENRRFTEFQKVLGECDGDRIYDELIKIRLEVSLATYLNRYLLFAADAGWEFAVREMIDNARYVLEAEMITFQDKVNFFDVLSFGIVHMRYEPPFFLKPETHNAEETRNYLEKSIASVEEILNEMHDKFVDISKAGWKDEKAKICCFQALLEYKSFLIRPWKQKRLLHAVRWMEKALEYVPDYEYALYHCAEWYLYLSNCRSSFLEFIGIVDSKYGQPILSARKHIDQLLFLIEKGSALKDRTVLEPHVLDLAMRIYGRVDPDHADEFEDRLEVVRKAGGFENNAEGYSDLPELPPKMSTLKYKGYEWLHKGSIAVGVIVTFIVIGVIVSNGMNAIESWFGEKPEETPAGEVSVRYSPWGSSSNEVGYVMFYAADEMLLSADTPVYTVPDLGGEKTGEIYSAGIPWGGFYNGSEWFEWGSSEERFYMSKENAVPMFVQADDDSYGMAAFWHEVVPVRMGVREGTKFYDSVSEDGTLGEVVRVMRSGQAYNTSDFEDVVKTSDGKYYYDFWDGYIAEEDITFFYARVSDLEAAGYDYRGNYRSNNMYLHYMERIGGAAE